MSDEADFDGMGEMIAKRNRLARELVETAREVRALRAERKPTTTMTVASSLATALASAGLTAEEANELRAIVWGKS